MVLETVAVEGDLGHASGLGLFSQTLADFRSGFDVAAGRFGFDAAGGDDGLAGGVVNDLSVNMAQAAEDRQTRTLGRTGERFANVNLAAGLTLGFNLRGVHEITSVLFSTCFQLAINLP